MQADPHELHNLAANAKYAGTLARLSAAVDDWQARLGNLRAVDERELVRQ